MNESRQTVSLGFRDILPFLEDTEPMSENMKQFILGSLAKSMERAIYDHFFDALKNLDDQKRQEELNNNELKSQNLQNRIDKNVGCKRTPDNEELLNCEADDLEAEQDDLLVKRSKIKVTHFTDLSSIWDFTAMIYHHQGRLNDRIGRYPYDYYVSDELLLGFIFDEFKLKFNTAPLSGTESGTNKNKGPLNLYQDCFRQYKEKYLVPREGNDYNSQLSEAEEEKSFRNYFRKETFETYQEIYLPPRNKYFLDTVYDRLERQAEQSDSDNTHNDTNTRTDSKETEDQFYEHLVNKSYDKLIGEVYRYNKVVRTNRYVSAATNYLPCFGFSTGDAIVFSETPELKYIPHTKDQLYILCLLLGCSFETFKQLREILTYEYNDETLFADNRLTTRDKLIQSVIRTYDDWCISVKNEYNLRHKYDECENMRDYDSWDKEAKYLPFLIMAHIDKRIARSIQAGMERSYSNSKQYASINDLTKFDLCIGNHLLLHNFMMERTSRKTVYATIFKQESDRYFEDRKRPEKQRQDVREICDFIFDAQEKYIIDRSRVLNKKGQVTGEA